MDKEIAKDDRRALVAWALYDWAGAPFTTLILTFVFPVYFARAVVGNAIEGQALWSYAVGTSGVLIAVFTPVLGAVADAAGRNKIWLFSSTVICAGASALLWYTQPTRSSIFWVVVLLVVANSGYVAGTVFNNAMLPRLVSKERTGRWSGWAWAFGYAGGLIGLALALVIFVENSLSWFRPDHAAENVRMIGPFVALWFGVFAWPRFVWTPDWSQEGTSLRGAIRQGFGTMRRTLGSFVQRGNVARFLLANMLYSDALVAIFAVGGVFAAGIYKMTLTEVAGFGILLNLTAGLGAFGFAWLDDRLGSRRSILFALGGLILSSLAAVLIDDRTWFWVAGAAMGFFVGPVQSSSRSFVAKLAPEGQEAEYFGLFALSGRATAFLGPALVGVATSVSQSQRIGLGSLIVLLVAGAAVLFRVSDPQALSGSSHLSKSLDASK